MSNEQKAERAPEPSLALWEKRLLPQPRIELRFLCFPARCLITAHIMKNLREPRQKKKKERSRGANILTSPLKSVRDFSHHVVYPVAVRPTMLICWTWPSLFCGRSSVTSSESLELCENVLGGGVWGGGTGSHENFQGSAPSSCFGDVITNHLLFAAASSSLRFFWKLIVAVVVQFRYEQCDNTLTAPSEISCHKMAAWQIVLLFCCQGKAVSEVRHPRCVLNYRKG